jgi:hypothetical protein
VVLPRASIFYPLSEDERLVEHVRRQASEEDKDHNHLLETARRGELR